MTDLFKDKIYSNNFFYINFKDLKNKILISRENKFSKNNLYSEIYTKIRSEDEIYKYLGKSKNAWKDTANFLNKIISKNFNKPLKVLSFGSGFGFIESYLSEYGHNITGIEFNKDERFWSPKVRYFSNLKDIKDEKFDMAYIVSVLYSFEDDELKKTLIDIKRLLNKDALLIVYEQDTRSILGSIKWLFLSAFLSINKSIFKDFVFWGYLRTDNQIKRLLDKLFVHQDSFHFGLGKDGGMVEMKKTKRFFGRQIFGRKNRSQLHIFKKGV